MHLRWKLTLEIGQKVVSSDGKTEQIRLEVPTLLSFLQKTSAFIEKQKNQIDFPLKKSEYPQIRCV